MRWAVNNSLLRAGMCQCARILKLIYAAFKIPQCSTLTKSSLCQETVVSCHLVSQIISWLLLSLPNCYLQWFLNDNMMKSIQLYSLPSGNETGVQKKMSLLNQINCKLCLPNDALWEWNCSLMGGSHDYFQESKLFNITVLSLIYFFVMKSSGCISTTWCFQRSHAMDNNFPIMKNISLSTTHTFSLHFIHSSMSPDSTGLHKCSSRNDHIVSGNL